MKITLEAARVNAKLTQKEAAEALGVSSATICNWEKGRSFPDVIRIMKICKLYNVSYDDLIFLPNDSL